VVAGEKKVVLYGNDDEWSRGFTKAIGEQLVAAGWEIVGEEYVPVGETDFYPMLTKIKSLDVPLMAGTMDDAAGFPAMIKQAASGHQEPDRRRWPGLGGRVVQHDRRCFGLRHRPDPRLDHP